MIEAVCNDGIHVVLIWLDRLANRCHLEFYLRSREQSAYDHVKDRKIQDLSYQVTKMNPSLDRSFTLDGLTVREMTRRIEDILTGKEQ